MLPGRSRGAWKHWHSLLWVFALALVPAAARGTPYDYIPVGDPIESELRILDLFDSGPLHNRIRLPHLATRPLQVIELQGIGAAPIEPDLIRGISLARIERTLGRDRSPLFSPHYLYTSTPRLFESNSEKTLLEISLGAEGRVLHDENGWTASSGSGLHGRLALGLDRLVAFSHYVVGKFDDAQTFADPIISNTDVIVLSEETFLSYTEERGQWATQFGQSRWHWGPGEEGSLVLSKTGPAITGLAFRAHHHALRADGIALNATLEQASGEQLAAHRIEWQLTDGMRVGITEAARYQSSGWQPLYLIGIIPYVLVQRLQAQAEPESSAALRNNVVMSVDAAWRIANGNKIYGEFLIDDLHTRSSNYPNKIAYQLGWEGAGWVARRRIVWGGEWTRLSRYVYTSFFGGDYAVNGVPLGFPTGPDARRIRLRGQLDLDNDWTVFGRVTHNDKGENDINEPFFPTSNPQPVDSFDFEGVVETTRDFELGLRWWPASGVYVAASGGYRWIKNADHITGNERRSGLATLELRINR